MVTVDLRKEYPAEEVAEALIEAIPSDWKRFNEEGLRWDGYQNVSHPQIEVLIRRESLYKRRNYGFSTTLDKERKYRRIDVKIFLEEQHINDVHYPAQEINGWPDDPNINGIWKTFKRFVELLHEQLNS